MTTALNSISSAPSVGFTTATVVLCELGSGSKTLIPPSQVAKLSTESGSWVCPSHSSPTASETAIITGKPKAAGVALGDGLTSYGLSPAQSVYAVTTLATGGGTTLIQYEKSLIYTWTTLPYVPAASRTNTATLLTTSTSTATTAPPLEPTNKPRGGETLLMVREPTSSVFVTFPSMSLLATSSQEASSTTAPDTTTSSNTTNSASTSRTTFSSTTATTSSSAASPEEIFDNFLWISVFLITMFMFAAGRVEALVLLVPLATMYAKADVISGNTTTTITSTLPLHAAEQGSLTTGGVWGTTTTTRVSSNSVT
jgi:hypothetical protein